MATFVRTVTAVEEAELALLVDSEDEVTRRRALCILMSKDGKTTGEIGAEFGLSERSVRNSVVAFNKAGVQSVPRAPVSGRPPRLSSVSNAAIEQIVADTPRDHGIDSDYWSLESFAAVLGKNLEIENLSADTLAREIKRRGLDWLQAKRSHAASKARLATMDAPTVQHDTRLTAAPPGQSPRDSKSGVYLEVLATPRRIGRPNCLRW